MAVLLVLMTLVVALTLDHVVQKLAARRARLANPSVERDAVAAAPLPATRPLPRLDAAPPVPTFLDASHCWIELAPSGLVAVGADALAAALLGPPERVSARPTGTFVARGEPLLTLHRGGRELTLRAPLSGLVTEHNGALHAAPAELSERPYRPNWLCRMQPQELGTALRGMVIADEAVTWLRGELARVREVLTALHQPAHARLGATAADGGLPEQALGAQLDDAQWQALVQRVFGVEEQRNTQPPA